jgi:N-acetyl-anhydromuramyl-L-alanine amidase AmpD
MAKKLEIQLQNRLRHNDSVEVHPATVEIIKPGGNVSAEASKYGEVSLDIASLADGAYSMRVTPANTSTGDVDSTLAETANPPARIYRSYEFSIQVAKGTVTSVTQTNTRDGEAVLDAHGKLTVRLQPLWMRGTSAGASTPRVIVIHETSGPVIGPAINTALDTGIGPHYEIDTDGQIVKFVQESQGANHAGPSRWNNIGGARAVTLNRSSIGIEIVHQSGDFREAQYVALLALLESILRANPDIPRSQIVGHSDVLTTDAGDQLGTDRDSDPGPNFDWPRLEGQNLGMVPKTTTTLAAGDYAGFFQLFPGDALRQGDEDAKSLYGGRTAEQRAKINPKPVAGQTLETLNRGNPIAELQADLRAIGYFVGSDQGKYGPATTKAVDKFQRHFFTVQRPHTGGATGRVDRATAEMIKKVRP